MKLPEPISFQLRSSRATLGRAGTEEYFSVVLCTANLGASNIRPGHDKLKHCFIEFRDCRGRVLSSYAHGPSGMSGEPYPHVSSVQRYPVAVVTADERQRLEHAVQERGAQPYRWGKNDCCSTLISAVQTDAGVSIPTPIAQAASDIRHSPPLA